jgi:pimeloyl-ACP methyl ester carboxylesterase
LVRSAARIVGAVLGFLLLTGAAVWGFRLETFFLYHPDRTLRGTPDRIGEAYRPVAFRAADGVMLHGWILPVDGARLAMVRFNGNGGTMADRLEWVQLLRRRLGIPITILLFDYRGYGRSEGRPTEEGLYRDGAAAVAALRAEAPGLPVVCVGESLGTAVAVDVAAAGGCESLVLEAPFASVPALADAILPIFPLGRFVRTLFDSRAKISRVRVPIYIAHAEGDALIPIRHAEQLLAAATAPARLIRLQRGGHSDAIFESADTYVPSLAAFLWEAHRPG